MTGIDKTRTKIGLNHRLFVQVDTEGGKQKVITV